MCHLILNSLEVLVITIETFLKIRLLKCLTVEPQIFEQNMPELTKRN